MRCAACEILPHNVGSLGDFPDSTLGYFERYWVLRRACAIAGLRERSWTGNHYTKPEKLLDMGPIYATTETQKTIPLPPVVGGLALVGGIVILVLGARRPEGKGIL